MRSVELFSGAGGLALGLAQAGFSHDALVEWDADSCETVSNNKKRLKEAKSWPLFQADVRRFAFDGIREDIDLLAGGVPCQPFSIGGKHLGHRDERNMFPEFLRAVRLLKPKTILVERSLTTFGYLSEKRCSSKTSNLFGTRC